MTRALIVPVACALLIAACGGSSSSPQGPTAATVAVRQSDVPSGMVRCDLTGDIDSFLTKEKTADQNTYQSTRSGWDHARSTGATAAYTSFYSDSDTHCTGITS